MSHLLLVEDEPNVRQPLADYLRKEGFVVTEAGALAQADTPAARSAELALLDWMLPDGQGIELLKRWRREGIDIPVILLTSRADLIDKVVGLELGANDYVTKPFEPRELVARIRVQLRMRDKRPTAQETRGHVIECAGIRLDSSTREVSFKGAKLELTKTEFDLLEAFVEAPNRVFSREELLKQVWGYDQYPTTRTVDTHVLQLRQKTQPELFETLHKIGYRFKAQAL